VAEIVRWEPRRDVTTLRDAMDRLFEDALIRPGWFAPAWGAAEMLPVDMYETEDDIVVKATVPGVKPDEIDVTVTGDLLTIKGEFKQEEKTEKPNYLRQERRFGSFCRQVGLPVGVNADKAKASFENGVLTLEMPKVEAAKTKTVKVSAK
jgi:HSP20 family protein